MVMKFHDWQGRENPWAFDILPMGSGFVPKTQGFCCVFGFFDIFQAMQDLREQSFTS